MACWHALQHARKRNDTVACLQILAAACEVSETHACLKFEVDWHLGAIPKSRLKASAVAGGGNSEQPPRATNA
jgi:hypothetical protein